MSAETVLVVGWAVSLAAVVLPQRSVSRAAGDARLWSERREAYVQVLDWLARDVGDPQGQGRPPHRLQVAVDLFGSDQLDVRLQAYRLAKTSYNVDQMVFQHGLLRLQVRYELDATRRRLDRQSLGLAGGRPVSSILAHLSGRYRVKHGLGGSHDRRPP